MAEQREPGFYWVHVGGNWRAAQWRQTAGRDGRWDVAGYATQRSLMTEELHEVGPRILPPSAAPSQPQVRPDVKIISWPETHWSDTAPSQPQQKDLVAVSVLHPEPGEPSNPAVERLIEAARSLLSAHGKLRVAAAVVMMTGLDSDSGMDLQKAQDEGARASENLVAALDAASPLTGPTNEGHRR